MKVYPEIITAADAIKHGGLIRAGYLHTKLATSLERINFLSIVYPSMPPHELAILADMMIMAFQRGQQVQEVLCGMGYCREVPKGIRR